MSKLWALMINTLLYFYLSDLTFLSNTYFSLKKYLTSKQVINHIITFHQVEQAPAGEDAAGHRGGGPGRELQELPGRLLVLGALAAALAHQAQRGRGGRRHADI